MDIRPNIMDLKFRKPEEVVGLLCERLRKERLYLEMTQADVAARAGIGVNTVSNLEAGRNVSFENLVRVAMVLGRLQELEELFKPEPYRVCRRVNILRDYPDDKIKIYP